MEDKTSYAVLGGALIFFTVMAVYQSGPLMLEVIRNFNNPFMPGLMFLSIFTGIILISKNGE